MSIDYLQCNAMRDILVCVLLPRLDTFSLVELLYVASRTLCQLVTKECRRRWSLDLDQEAAHKKIRLDAMGAPPRRGWSEGDILQRPYDPFAGIALRRRVLKNVAPPLFVMMHGMRWEGYILALFRFHMTPSLLQWMGPTGFRARIFGSPHKPDCTPLAEIAIAEGLASLSVDDGCVVAKLLRAWKVLDFETAAIVKFVPAPTLALMDLRKTSATAAAWKRSLVMAFESGSVETVRYVAQTWNVSIDSGTMMSVLLCLSHDHQDNLALFMEMVALWPLVLADGTRGPVLSDEHFLGLPAFARAECWERLYPRMSSAHGSVPDALIDTLNENLARQPQYAMGLARFLWDFRELQADVIISRIMPQLFLLRPEDRVASGIIPFLRDVCRVDEAVFPAPDAGDDNPPRLVAAVDTGERYNVDMPPWTPLV